MLARPERKMQMGLLAYIRRLFGGGDAEIRLMRLPQKTADAASNNKKVLPSVFLCSSAWKFSPAKKRKNKSEGGKKTPKLTTTFQPFQPTCIQNQRSCPPHLPGKANQYQSAKKLICTSRSLSQHYNSTARVDLQEQSSSS